jgi:CheY-like chemotaxis protein
MTGQPSKPPGPAPEAASASGAGRPLVLIVEDEEPIAEALVYIVEDAGYTALRATNGKDGLALALQHRPALIFTDLMMPQMGGRELIVALHEALDSKSPPVVLMTAANIRYTDDAGADSVLKKPFELNTFEKVLERFLPPGPAR